jgi:exoribonuclease R
MISGVLHLTNKTKYGMTSRNVPMYLFRPFDRNEPPYVVGCSQPDTTHNVLALVEPMDLNQRIPRGNLVRILGRCGDWKAEREAIHWTYQPYRQPKLTTPVVTPPVVDRIDLRGYRTLHVDPPGCQDIDDCVTFWEDKCVVTIADVGSWVAANPHLQVFAKNGQTLYDNGMAVRPMFPKEFSEDLFSLRPQQDRLGVSVIYERNHPPRWALTQVRVTESYTYEEANGIPELKQWASYVAERELPDDPHIWIEAFMIRYNLFMATQLPEQALLRCHEQPKQDLFELYSAICPEATRLAETAAVYDTLSSRRLHWGMGRKLYTHMTSPIRRWADVHNQMCLLGHHMLIDIEMLNLVNKKAKKHARDLFFLDQLQKPQVVYGVALDTKSRVWVSEWKRVLTIDSVEPGTRVKIEYYLDMNQPTWKKRMVTRASTDCPV